MRYVAVNVVTDTHTHTHTHRTISVTLRHALRIQKNYTLAGGTMVLFKQPTVFILIERKQKK